MRLPIQRTAAIVSAGLLISMTGCATKPEPIPEPELPDRVMAMDVGVNYIEPTSDIVIMDSSYQHVVLPDGAQVAYRPGWEEDAMAVAASKLGDEQINDDLLLDREKIGKDSSDLQAENGNLASATRSLDDLPPAADSDDPVYRAWRKLCSMNIEGMSEEEYEIITSGKSMPSEFEGLCDEGLNWLAELK